MPQGNKCRLCAETCHDYKSLYDKSRNSNEVQQLMIQYFDENLLHTVTGNNSNVLCMKCWHTISDFNSFQQSIYRAQRILRIKDEEIDIKSEEEFVSEKHIPSSNCEQPTDWDIVVGEEATLSRCDNESVHVASADDTSNTDDNVVYDDPVGIFVGGEFGNESSSSELLVETEPIAECNEASKIKNKLTKSGPQNRLSISVKASDDLIAQWTQILKCVYCTETCSTFSLLQRHFHYKHPLCKYKVKCCSRTYYARYRFEDHIRLHIDPNAFACTFCGTNKTNRNSLARHIREHHTVSNRAIINSRNDSNTVDSSSANVTKYMKKSDDFISKVKQTLNCYLCSEKYTKFSLFRQHFSENHPDEKFYIKCCQRKLTKRCHILEHLELHANPDEFKCKLCELRCKTREILKTHIRTRHTTPINEIESTSKQENNPAKIHEKLDDLLSKWLPCTECAVCKEAFATLTELELHFLECHPGEAFYVECCQQKLMTQRKIRAHVRYHVKPTKFKCDLCGLCYNYNRGLKHHMRAVH